MLQSNTSCREVVRHVQALFALHSQSDVDEGTSAYCQARQKLASTLLVKAFHCVYKKAEKLAPASKLLQGRSPLRLFCAGGLAAGTQGRSDCAVVPLPQSRFSQSVQAPGTAGCIVYLAQTQQGFSFAECLGIGSHSARDYSAHHSCPHSKAGVPNPGADGPHHAPGKPIISRLRDPG